MNESQKEIETMSLNETISGITQMIGLSHKMGSFNILERIIATDSNKRIE